MASSTTMVRPGEIVQAAISRGDLARVRDLLRNGASATERGRHDTTALHWAAAANEAAIVRELLDHGADPNARAADGCSALHYAARGGRGGGCERAARRRRGRARDQPRGQDAAAGGVRRGG
jgi:ankyrin repeat protein